MQLQPCPACKRHVSIDAASCPFCAIALAAGEPNHGARNRMCRAAIFAASAAVTLAASTTGCWTNKNEPQHVQQQVVVTPDAAPPADAAAVIVKPNDVPDDNYQNHPCFDGPNGPVCAPYGAPPARRRVV